MSEKKSRQADSGKTFTTKPLAAGDCGGVPKLWGRWQDVFRIYSLSRSYQYLVGVKRGEWRTVSLREPHKQTGIRLFYLPSIAAWLDKKAAETDADEGKAA